MKEHELVETENLSELIRADKKFAEAVKFMKVTSFQPDERGNVECKL